VGSPVGKTISRYRVEELLGSGGMGAVYRARDERLDRAVALKILSEDALTSSSARQRFVREAQLAATLNHPNIVTIYEVEEADGYHFIAMEYVEGETLRARVARAPLSLQEIVQVGGDVAEALEAAHAVGLIHRDIKPANILLTDSGQPKILDFGIARLAAGGLTRPGKFFGTPNYMSPEQVTGSNVDGRTDQFSLGVILYQLLTGEKPFVGDSVTAISYQVVNVEPPPPTKLNPALRPPFDRIVRKVLSKNASDRYPRCADLSNDLKTAVGEWRESAEKSTPPTLVSREESASAAAETGEGGKRGVTFLAPRFARILAGHGSPLGVGWIAFLVCLVLLAAAPFLLYRSPARRSGGPQPLGLLTSPSGARTGDPALSGIGVAPSQAAPDPAQAGRLRVTLSHRFNSGRIEVRIDGAKTLEDRLRGTGSKTRFVRTLSVPAGSHRVEVRVTSGKTFDGIEGIQGEFRTREQRELAVSVSPISKRLKLRFEEPEMAEHK